RRTTRRTSHTRGSQGNHSANHVVQGAAKPGVSAEPDTRSGRKRMARYAAMNAPIASQLLIMASYRCSVGKWIEKGSGKQMEASAPRSGGFHRGSRNDRTAAVDLLGLLSHHQLVSVVGLLAHVLEQFHPFVPTEVEAA